MKRLNRRDSSRQGGMLILVALSLVALIGMAGLVIDGGYIYLVRQKSQCAADAAALAAAHEVAVNSALTTAQLQTAMNFSAIHAANLNNMGGLPATVSVVKSGNQITVTNYATVTPFFLSAFGVGKISINDYAIATAFSNWALPRSDVIICIDRSSSFSPLLDGAKSGVQQILNAMNESVNNDCKVGFVYFNGHGYVQSPLSQTNTSINTIRSNVNALVDCSSDFVHPCSGSDLAAGYETAFNMFFDTSYTRTSGAAQTIIFVSDGAASVSNTLTQYHSLGNVGDNNKAVNDAKNAYTLNAISSYSVYFQDGGFNAIDSGTMANMVAGTGAFTTVTNSAAFGTSIASTVSGTLVKLTK